MLDELVNGRPIGVALPALLLRRFRLQTPVAGDPVHTTRIGVTG